MALLLPADLLAQDQVVLDHGEPVPGYGARWPEFVPGTTHDPSVPTLESVVGHAIRDAVTSPEEMVRWFEAVAAAESDRTRLVEYGRTWEGRPLIVFFVGSPENIARLDEVGAGLRRLADPTGLTATDEEALVSDLPAHG